MVRSDTQILKEPEKSWSEYEVEAMLIEAIDLIPIRRLIYFNL